MAAILRVNKIKSKTPDGKWFTAVVADIQIIRGKIHFLPRNKKYQYLKLSADNCIIVG